MDLPSRSGPDTVGKDHSPKAGQTWWTAFLPERMKRTAPPIVIVEIIPSHGGVAKHLGGTPSEVAKLLLAQCL